MPQEFLKYPIPDYLSGALTTANTTIAIQCEQIKIILIIFVKLAKKIFGVPQNFNSLCVPSDERG